jgi:hypothetical protein
VDSWKSVLIVSFFDRLTNLFDLHASLTYRLLRLLVLAELLVAPNAEIAFGALKTRQMKVAKPRNSFTLSLDPLIAALAHVILGKLADSRLVLCDVSVVHALNVHRLSVAHAVLGGPNRLPAVCAHNAFFVEVERLTAIALKLANVIAALERLAARAADLAVRKCLLGYT